MLSLSALLLLALAVANAQAQIAWNGNWALGCDFRGNDLSNARVRGEDCGSRCDNTAGCTHFTWTNFNGGTCWMKRGPVAKGDAVAADRGTVCGIANSKVQWNGNWASGCDFKGRDIGNARTSGEQCGGKCSSTSGCTHFTWTNLNGGTCWMKSGAVAKSDCYRTGNQGMICGIAGGSPDPSPGPSPDPVNKLLWSSEFNSINELDQDWIQETGGHGFGNNEAQFYTDGRRNVEVANGELVIKAKRESFGGKSYTSAKLVSKRKFKYGFFEIRAKVPTGRGIWPAFWLLGAPRPVNWPRDGEIDVLEYVGYQPRTVHATIHCAAYNHIKKTQKGTTAEFNDKEYNLFQLDWKPTSITIMVNNKVYFRFDKESNNYDVWPFDNEFNIILNVAVGGDWGGVMGIDDGIFPTNFNIEYVRQYAN